MEKIVSLLKSIFLVTTSSALVLFGYVLSGGTYNIVSSVLFVLGIILFLVGILVGVNHLTSDKDEKK